VPKCCQDDKQSSKVLEKRILKLKARALQKCMDPFELRQEH